MATREVTRRLDLEAMSNREVLSELCRIYGDLLERLSNYTDALDAGHVDEEELDRSPTDDGFDAIYDEAMGLISRINKVSSEFRSGSGSLVGRDGRRWNWGLNDYERKFQERVAAALAVDGGGLGDDR